MLTLVPTPIGNLDDISLRSIEAFKGAEVLLCEDTRVTKRLLSLLAEKLNIRFPDYRFHSFHSHNETQFIQSLTPDFFDANCLYVSDAGMPGISDPGLSLVQYCQEHTIPYDVLPGANAALTSIVMSGFDTVHFSFYGFLPHKGKERQSALVKALASGQPTIFYESPHRIDKLIDELAQNYPETMVFAIKELTKMHQKYYKAPAKKLAEIFTEINKKGEWVVIVDSVAEGEYDPELLTMLKSLHAPKKDLAKIIAKVTGRPPKICYNELLDEKG